MMGQSQGPLSSVAWKMASTHSGSEHRARAVEERAGLPGEHGLSGTRTAVGGVKGAKAFTSLSGCVGVKSSTKEHG